MNTDSADDGAKDHRLLALSSIRHAFTEWKLSEADPSTVIQYLARRLTHIDSQSWDLRLALGGIYLNGQRLLEDKQLSAPCRIEYYEPKFSVAEAENFFPKLSSKNILYRQNGIIAIYKPAGLPSMPAKDQNRFNLPTAMKNLLGAEIDLHFPSRLDTSVQGLVLMSEDRKLHNPLQKLFVQRNICKRYLAIVSPVPVWEQVEVKLPIGRDPNWGVLRKIDDTQGQSAHTSLEKLRQGPEGQYQSCALVAVFPRTGRTHQIRVHLSAIGYPIIGDAFYGGLESESLHLMSESIEFRHPFTGDFVRIKVPPSFRPAWALEPE